MDMREDVIMLKDGSVMVIRDGKMVPLGEELTLSDGTRVTMDGKVILPDGTSRMMMEGEAMEMDGQMVDTADMTDRQFTEEMEDEELRDDME